MKHKLPEITTFEFAMDGEMEPVEDGAWVRSEVFYAHVEALGAEREALAAKLKELDKQITKDTDDFLALAAKVKQMEAQEPCGKVLLRQDEDGREPVMFYGGDSAPEQGTFKDRFELVSVFLAPGANPDAKDAARWKMLAHMEADRAATATLAHYIANPDQLDYVIHLKECHDAAIGAKK